MTLTWKMLVFLLTLTAAGMFFKLELSEWQPPINEQLPYKMAQAHMIQNRNSLDKKLEDQNLQEKSVEAKNILPQDQNAQEKHLQDQNAQDKNIQDQNAQDKNIQDQNAQDKNIQDQNAQDKNIQDQNAQDKKLQDQNAQEKNVQDQNAQEKNVQDQNAQEKNVQDQNAQEKNVQDQNAQDKNIQDQNAQDKNIQDQNAQDKNIQDQNAQDKKLQDQNAQDKNIQDQNAQDKNIQDQNAQDQNAQDINIQKKTPCGCQKCFSKDDKFLMSCFNPSIEPFLSASSTLSLNVFMWWKHLQNERRDFNYYKTAVANLFKIFPPVPSLRNPSPGKCRTCAVVGNSVNLRGSGYGFLIDGHDIVIRMNGAPTTGYEKDVGTKTTHRVLYPESAVDLDNSTHLVVFAFKIQDLQWPTKALTTGFYTMSYRKVKPKINANKDLVMVVNPAFMKYVHEIWMKRRGMYPSTGFMTLILSLHVCDEVHVFGFGADSNGNWSHYFEVLKNKNYRTGPHSGTKEYTVLQRLASEKTVTLYKGS